MISTVKSPIFSVIVVYQRGDFYNSVYSREAQGQLGDEDTWYHEQFEVFREVYRALDFRLVLRARIVGDVSVRELERAVAVEKAKGSPTGIVGGLHPGSALRAQKGYLL